MVAKHGILLEWNKYENLCKILFNGDVLMIADLDVTPIEDWDDEILERKDSKMEISNERPRK